MTDEQILKIAISHQRQMGSVHPHAIIGTIEDAINEALKISSNVPVIRRLPTSEEIKRWHAILTGKGEDEMQKDIEATFV